MTTENAQRSAPPNSDRDDVRLESVKLAAEYVQREFGVPPSEFQLDYDGVDAATGYHHVSATHVDDLKPDDVTTAGGGSGQSRLMTVDLGAHRVESALRWQ